MVDFVTIEQITIIVIIIALSMFGMYGLMFYRRRKENKNSPPPIKISGEIKPAPITNGRKVYVCPTCDSRDIKSWSPESNYGLKGPNTFECRNCGYNGPMSTMLRTEADKLEIKKVKKK